MSPKSTNKLNLPKNQISFSKPITKGKNISFLSIPWSYGIVSIGFILIGVLDFILLGHLIGHPEDPTIGQYIGQGNAVFLGGISFFYTVGFMPLLIGFILFIYSLCSIKRVSVVRNDKIITIHERKLIFSLTSKFGREEIQHLSLSNQGMKFKHIWILIFIPMAIGILQFGIPLFGEHLAQDNILPTMMTITALIDLIGVALVILFPHYRLIFESETHQYKIIFFPIAKQKKYIQQIQQSLELDIPSNSINPQIKDIKIEEDEEIQDTEEGKREFYQIDQKDYFRLIFGIVLIITSIIGAGLQFLWGTALYLIASIYGFYLIARSFFYHLPDYTYVSANPSLNQSLIVQQNRYSLNAQKKYTIINSEDLAIEYRLRKITIIDSFCLVAIFYYSTVSLIFGWQYLTDSSWLLILDMVLSTLIWCIICYGILQFLLGSNEVFQIGNEGFKINHNYSWNPFFDISKHLKQPQMKFKIIFRATIGVIILIVTLLITFLGTK